MTIYLSNFIDIFIPGKKLAVQVDGPSHYYIDSHESTRSSLFKEELLKAVLEKDKKGCKLISIPYWEWESVKDKSNYLEMKIRQVVES